MAMMKTGFWFYLAAIIAMGITLSAFNTINAFLLKNIIEMGQRGDSSGLVPLLKKCMLLGIITLVIYLVGSITYTIQGKRGYANLQKTIFFKSFKLPYSYYENTHSGDFMSKIMYDCDRSSEIYGSRFRRILMPAIMVVFNLIPMFMLSPVVTLCLMGVCMVTFIINGLFIKPLKNLGRSQSKKHGLLTEKLTNILSGMELIKAFSLDDKMVNDYVEVNQDFYRGQRKRSAIGATLDSLNTGFDLLSSIVFIAVGLFFVSMHVTTVENLAALYIIYASLSWNFLQIGIYIPDISNCLVNAQRVFDFLDLKEESAVYSEITGGTQDFYISMEHVDFTYDFDQESNQNSENQASNNLTISDTSTDESEHHKVLSDFSMYIRQGTTVALKGESGKGKSTIAKILLGFYPIQNGSITIAGKPYNSMTLETIRSMIGYVPQEPYLYNESIAENISYGRPNASMEEIIAAAKAANAHEFILKQENGYETIVGERGNLLSGGEKQRIAIARAILKNAPILILDEATSALDNESERLVSEALERLMQGRTTIMIAHRLSTLERADQVIEI